MYNHTSMQQHFSCLAPSYNELRTTDPEPVAYIRDLLGGRPVAHCLDIGCGAGRYDLLLLRAFPEMNLTCCDINQAMLDEADRYLGQHDMSRFTLQLADAETFSFTENGIDCIFTFNALHHFDPVAFLDCSARTLGPDGYVFIYTRLHEQNEETIWGRFFPHFSAMENRLYRSQEIEHWACSTDRLQLVHVQPFCYPRRATLEQLVALARNRHYSTFDFYTSKQLEEAVDEFQRAIYRNFADSTDIHWFDGNVMIVLKST